MTSQFACYPAIRSIGQDTKFTVYLFFVCICSYGFLNRGNTDLREILHGSLAWSRTGLLPFWGDSPRDGRVLGVNRGHMARYASCWSICSLSNAIHGIGQIKITPVFVCPSVRLKYLLLSIATAVFVRSSSHLKCRSHIWHIFYILMSNISKTVTDTAMASMDQRWGQFGLCYLLAPCCLLYTSDAADE